MGKTRNHTRSPETQAKYEARQRQQRLVASITANYNSFALNDWDDLTVADLAGLDHAANAAREG